MKGHGMSPVFFFLINWTNWSTAWFIDSIPRIPSWTYLLVSGTPLKTRVFFLVTMGTLNQTHWGFMTRRTTLLPTQKKTCEISKMPYGCGLQLFESDNLSCFFIRNNNVSVSSWSGDSFIYEKCSSKYLPSNSQTWKYLKGSQVFLKNMSPISQRSPIFSQEIWCIP